MFDWVLFPQSSPIQPIHPICPILPIIPIPPVLPILPMLPMIPIIPILPMLPFSHSPNSLDSHNSPNSMDYSHWPIVFFSSVCRLSSTLVKKSLFNMATDQFDRIILCTVMLMSIIWLSLFISGKDHLDLHFSFRCQE